MRSRHAALTSRARTGVIVLCLLLAASVSGRIYIYRQQPEAGEAAAGDAAGGPIDLGGGILLPRSAAQHRTVPVGSCVAPASIHFVAASPYGSDPSLVGAPGSDDRVFYVYRGWSLGSRLATISLNAIYFSRRAYARLRMQETPATDDLAVKIIVPTGCEASAEEVMSNLRLALHPPAPSSVPGSAPRP
ncbi:hypothetical protein [Methylobacterium sp. NEAU K]|uniref:hypothetical protein n=1 Tax=Methylobacterium sp. NEAU K TaxID=3064946 RepID=UPI00273314BA|nr:hypothetical protein [Methylobacterium sp. NEAU K]MDP4005184.1 hypothetical protein [Methylobacterium sp. NEAU K]